MDEGQGLSRAQYAELLNLIAMRKGGGGTGPTSTVQTILEGVTYAQAATDKVILFDTSGGPQATATLNMIPGVVVGQQIMLKWWAWGNLQTPPTIVAPTDTNLLDPFSGMAASGTAGLVASTIISTPGASWSLVWSGVYWLSE